jgi:ankyrin repeat protein/Tfp pilus assembly protein PilF
MSKSQQGSSISTLLISILTIILVSSTNVLAQPKTSGEADTLLAKAKSQSQSGNQWAAIETLKKAIVIDPGNAPAHVELARMYISLNFDDLARTAVGDALKTDPKHAPARQTLAALLRRAGDLEGAIREAKLALTLKPDTATEAYSHVTIGRALNRMNRGAEATVEFEKAVLVYQQLTRQSPADPLVVSAMGNLLFDLQRFSKAEAAYRRAVDLEPQDIDSLLMLGRALQNQGRKDEAVKVYKEYLLKPAASDKSNVEARIKWLETATSSELFGHLLLNAAKDGATANAKVLLAKGADANFLFDYQTPLSLAARAGYMELVQLLLAHGAKDNDGAAITGAYAEGNTEIEKLLAQKAVKPLGPKIQNRFLSAAIVRSDPTRFAAALDAGADQDKNQLLLDVVSKKEAHIDIVRALLARGAHVNQETKYKTALMHAASEGHTEILKLLLTKGAAVNAQTDEGTALMMAVVGKHADIAKLLLSAGANVEAKHRLGDTALMMAARSMIYQTNKALVPNPSIEIMQILLANGAQSNARGDWERTALMHANTASKVKLLLAHSADVNARDKDGETALIRAATAGAVDVVEALVQGGAEVNAKDAKGETALLHALSNTESMHGEDAKRKAQGRLEAARRLLLAKNLDVNIQNDDGESALMRAIRLVDTEMVKLLLTRAADVNASDIFDQTPFVLAFEKGSEEIEKLLQAAAPQRQTPGTINAFLKAAIAKGEVEKVSEFLAKGADANYQYSIGYDHKSIKRTVLILAASLGQAGIVQMLLDKGADINAKGLLQGSEHGLKYGTALEAAELGNHAEVVSMLKKTSSPRN